MARVPRRSLVRDTRGNVMITFALSLVPLLGLVGAAVDYSRLAHTRTDLQVVADSAALAGVTAMARAYAAASASQEQIAVETATAVVSGRAPGSLKGTTASASLKRVEVTLEKHEEVIFGSFLGTKFATVGAKGTATYSATGPAGCVVALNASEPVGIEMAGSSVLSAPKCFVQSNATSTTSMNFASSTTLTATKTCAVGLKSGGGTQSPTVQTGCPPLPDPYAGKAFPSYSSCTQPYTEVKTNATLSPGEYCGLFIQGSGINVTLNPGLYVIKDGIFSIQGSPAVTATGVSFYLVGSAYFEFQGNPALSISAMTTGDFAGLALASSPSGAAATSMIKGSGATVLSAGSTGGIYLPNQKLVVDGNAELTLSGSTNKVLARSILLGGSAKLSVAADALAISMMTSSSRLE